MNDFFVKNKSLKKYKKVLVVFPHPDDEVMTVSGLIQKLAKQNITTVLLTLTKGERGTRDASLRKNLKMIRSKEIFTAVKLLQFSHFFQKDLGDGNLENKKEDMRKIIRHAIFSEKPDLIITYDLAGLYGHTDHIVCSEVVTEIITKEFPNIALWYSALPKKILKLIKLPEHMAKNPKYKDRRVYPTHKVFVAPFLFNKIRAVYAHHSQVPSYKRSIPIPFLPLPFVYSLSLFEYFYEVQAST